MKKLLLLFVASLIYAGVHSQQIIKPTAITQTAGTSESALGLSLDDLITGSGLSSEPATVGDLATTTHAVAWADSWATADEGTPSYFGDAANYPDVVFELDLGATFDVTSFAYWGYPVFPLNNPKDITLEFSTNGGTTYIATENLSLASSVDGGSGIVHQAANLSTSREANFVRLTITDNHGGGRIGFGELRFGGTPQAGLPSDPSNLMANTTSSTEITVNWDDNSNNETGFKLERKEGSGAYVEIATPAADATSFNDSGLSPYTVYTYRIKATNGIGDSLGSSEGGNATNAVNGNATVLVTPTAIVQTQANSEGCCGLSVGDMIDDSGLSVGADVTNVNSVTHSGNFGEGNAFATATDQGGGYFSASNPDPIFTLDLGDSYNMSGLVIWGYPLDSSAEAKDFTLEFSTDGGSTYTGGTENVVNASALGGNSNAAILNFSQVRTANFVRMTFTDNHGGGRAALGEAKFVGALEVGLPDAPSNLMANTTSSTEITVNWDDNSNNETGFKLERKEGSGAYVEIATPAANATSFNDSGLTPYTVYTYRITATNGTGDSTGNSEGGNATNAVNGNATVLVTPTAIVQTQADSEGCCGLSVGDMIDDSGLSVGADVTNVNSVIHSGNFGEGNAFATATDQGGGYFSASNPDPIFTLGLGDSYNMSGLVIWGYPLDSSAEAKDFTLEFSTDGGSNYTGGTENVVNVSALGGNSNAAILTFSQVRTANFVRMTFTDNHGGGRAALGEAKFIGALSTTLSITTNGFNEFKLYPNPTTDFIQVSNIKEKSSAKIFDILGKELKSLELFSSSKKIDVSKLKPGLYFLSINNNASLKFIKN